VKISAEIRGRKKGYYSNQEQMCLEGEQAAHRSASREIAGVNFRLVGQIKNKSKMKRP
jgi:hypothetical protein